jgi:hypothetical protein
VPGARFRTCPPEDSVQFRGRVNSGPPFFFLSVSNCGAVCFERAVGCAANSKQWNFTSVARISPETFSSQMLKARPQQDGFTPLSGMLHDERNRGVVFWNRTRKGRDPQTGRRVQRERPKSEWVVLPAPHLQIVCEELWSSVERRLAAVHATFSSGTSPGLCSRSFPAQYLLSGFFEVRSVRGQDSRVWPQAARACKVWLSHETCARCLRFVEKLSFVFNLQTALPYAR